MTVIFILSRIILYNLDVFLDVSNISVVRDVIFASDIFLKNLKIFWMLYYIS